MTLTIDTSETLFPFNDPSLQRFSDDKTAELFLESFEASILSSD